MNESFHKDEFESYLYKQVSNHRMYPADQLWRNIQKELHGEGRWPALTYISIFIITVLAISTMMVKPEDRLHKNSIVYPPQKEEIVFEKTKESERNNVSAAPVEDAYTDKITQQTIQSVSEIMIAREEKQNAIQSLTVTKESLLTVQDKTIQENSNLASEIAVKTPACKQPESLQSNAVAIALLEDKSSVPVIAQYAIVAKPASRYFSTLELLNLSDLKKPSDNQSSAYNNDDLWRNFPLLGATDSWRRKLSKLSFQFYVTPSVSYRRLTSANGKNAGSYTAVPQGIIYQLDNHHVVENYPAVGAEVGFALGYKLSNTLTAKGGLQFNVRQYGIKAYLTHISGPSSDAGTQNVVSVSNPDEESIDNSYSTSANNSSDASQPIVLNNRYYELTVPVALDWRIITSGNGNLAINAAASLQPTYTFDKEPIVITNNYTDAASIIRNWNLNSNVEAYISYKLGSFRWQLGPQFRYQHFSTYSNAYPIREHLFDYGIKLGFTKSLD